MSKPCAYCRHLKKDHCPGRRRHPNYKDEMLMRKAPRISVCMSQHCEVALCDCLQFQEPKP